jgi:mercuric transport protein
MFKLFAALGIAATAGALSICPLCGNSSVNSLGGNALHAQPVAPASLRSTGIAQLLPVTSTVTLKISGMTCGGCVLGVRKVLMRLDGVARADVSYEKGNAVVTFDPKKASVRQMIAAIKTLGYTAVVAG